MRLNKLFVSILILFILTVSIGTIYAADDLNNNTITSDNSADNLEKTDENTVSTSNDDVLSKTIIVPFDPKEPNDVLWPKIQPAIDGANSGDTIIIKGSPVHVHATINKKLNIIADYDSTIDACPHHTHEGLTEHGIFYITKEGSGSTIQGFTFVNNDKAETPFAILIDGARDITIKDCTMNYNNPEVDKLRGIVIKNSNNVKLSNLLINNTINGITIIDSSNIDITDCILSFNDNYAVTISGDSRNINIKSNSIMNNGNSGINLSSVNNVNILNNYIKDNGKSNKDTGSGIYVNANITKLVVKGNIFLSNGRHAILYDYRTRNLNREDGADLLTIVDDNYFEGHKSMVLHHRIYREYPNGDMKYDAEKDIYYKSDDGDYIEDTSTVYMQHAFIYHDIPCGHTYYTTKIPWTLDAPGNNGKYNFYLNLSEIKEIKPGLYQISIVDSQGNIAADFNGGYIAFFLNDCSSVAPQEGNIYNNALIKNGVATADFRRVYNSFKTTDNIITAVFPGVSGKIENSLYKKFNVKNIPISPVTKLSSSKLITYPLSENYISAKLVDSKNKPITGQKVTFKFNGKTYTAKTNSKGVAEVKVSLETKKTYTVTIKYSGNDDYKASKVTSKILVKTGSKKSQIKALNMKIKKNEKKTFKLKLTTSAGKALKNQKIVVKVNGKSSIIKTDKKGIAKINVKFNKVKIFKINMKFLGDSNFKAVSQTKLITVYK